MPRNIGLGMLVELGGRVVRLIANALVKEANTRARDTRLCLASLCLLILLHSVACLAESTNPTFLRAKSPY